MRGGWDADDADPCGAQIKKDFAECEGDGTRMMWTSSTKIYSRKRAKNPF
jgi:hypothetical protein